MCPGIGFETRNWTISLLTWKCVYLADIIRKGIAVIFQQMVLVRGVNISQAVNVLDEHLSSQECLDLRFDTSCGSSVMPMSLISTGVPY